MSNFTGVPNCDLTEADIVDMNLKFVFEFERWINRDHFHGIALYTTCSLQKAYAENSRVVHIPQRSILPQIPLI